MKKKVQEKDHIVRISYSAKLMLFMFTIILVVASFITISSYNLAVATINDAEFNLVEASAEKTYTSVNMAFESVERSLTRIINLPVVRNSAENDYLSEQEITSNKKSIAYSLREYLNNLKTGYDINNVKLEFITLFMKNGLDYSTHATENLPFNSFNSCTEFMKDMYNPSITDYNSMTWVGTINTKNGSGVEIRCSICVRYIYDRVTMEKIGIVVTGIDEAFLYSIYKTTFPNAFIIQGDGIILSSATQSQIGMPLENMDLLEFVKTATWPEGNIKDISYDKSDMLIYGKNDFFVIYFIIPYKEARIPGESTMVYARKSILIALSASILGILITFFVIRRMSKSILSLNKVVQQVYGGDLKARYTLKRKKIDEIEYIGKQFNDMMEAIEGFYKTQELDAAEKKNLEIRLLQSQINPHLLYNTLESAVWAIKSNDNSRAEKLIYSLSVFFRTALAKGRNLIALEEELEILRSYIVIQNLARRKQFVLLEEIPADMYSCIILRMTLQPILENSIVHGFSGHDKGIVTIHLELLSNGREIEIVVRDNGVGMDEETVQELNLYINQKPIDSTQKYFGLYNVNQRIQKHYGKEYGLKIASEVGDYTEIRVIMPYAQKLEQGRDAACIK